MQSIKIKNGDKPAKLATALKNLATDANVFMCIGTEKVIADSLGPRVGHNLNSNLKKPLFVYGMTNKNITAENLLYSYEFIKKLHPTSKIVVIDAAVGAKHQVGDIQISAGGIVPGAATNKDLPEIGDISIVGIVAESGLSDFYTSNSYKLNLVNKLADFISSAINTAYNE